MLSCRSLREMRRDLHRQREWRLELERLRAGAAVGCLHVELRTLRSLLLSATLAATEQVHLLSDVMKAARRQVQSLPACALRTLQSLHRAGASGSVTC